MESSFGSPWDVEESSPVDESRKAKSPGFDASLEEEGGLSLLTVFTPGSTFSCAAAIIGTSLGSGIFCVPFMFKLTGLLGGAGVVGRSSPLRAPVLPVDPVAHASQSCTRGPVAAGSSPAAAGKLSGRGGAPDLDGKPRGRDVSDSGGNARPRRPAVCAREGRKLCQGEHRVRSRADCSATLGRDGPNQSSWEQCKDEAEVSECASWAAAARVVPNWTLAELGLYLGST